MIGIIGAMEIEVADLRKLLDNPEVKTVSGIDFYSGRLCDKDVVVARSGVGKVFAAVCAQTMIREFGVTAIINSGIAGTLTDELRIGDVAISTGFVQHDMDTSAVGDPIGMISGINMIDLPADADMAEALKSVCAKMEMNCRSGKITSGDQFVASRDRRVWISETFGGIACEMEAASIAQVCYINKIPCVAIRVISDEASGEVFDDYATFSRRAADISTSLTEALLWHL